MKKFISAFTMIIMLTACMKAAAFLPGEAADCFLCGWNEESPMSAYRGKNSLGILCTDRFSVSDVYAGKRSAWGKGGTGENSMRMTVRGELRGVITIGGNHDRGISEISIELGEKDRLDLEQLQGKLCETCMEKFVQMQEEGEKEQADVFLVDFKNAEIYALDESRRFYAGEYFVIVDVEKEKISVTVAYAPA